MSYFENDFGYEMGYEEMGNLGASGRAGVKFEPEGSLVSYAMSGGAFGNKFQYKQPPSVVSPYGAVRSGLPQPGDPRFVDRTKQGTSAVPAVPATSGTSAETGPVPAPGATPPAPTSDGYKQDDSKAEAARLTQGQAPQDVQAPTGEEPAATVGDMKPKGDVIPEDPRATYKPSGSGDVVISHRQYAGDKKDLTLSERILRNKLERAENKAAKIAAKEAKKAEKNKTQFPKSAALHAGNNFINEKAELLGGKHEALKVLSHYLNLPSTVSEPLEKIAQLNDMSNEELMALKSEAQNIPGEKLEETLTGLKTAADNEVENHQRYLKDPYHPDNQIRVGRANAAANGGWQTFNTIINDQLTRSTQAYLQMLQALKDSNGMFLQAMLQRGGGGRGQA